MIQYLSTVYPKLANILVCRTPLQINKLLRVSNPLGRPASIYYIRSNNFFQFIRNKMPVGNMNAIFNEKNKLFLEQRIRVAVFFFYTLAICLIVSS